MALVWHLRSIIYSIDSLFSLFLLTLHLLLSQFSISHTCQSLTYFYYLYQLIIVYITHINIEQKITMVQHCPTTKGTTIQHCSTTKGTTTIKLYTLYTLLSFSSFLLVLATSNHFEVQLSLT